MIVSVPPTDDTAHAWFVESKSTPGAFYRVAHSSAHADHYLRCSCPHGAFLATTPEGRPCRHMRAVGDLLAEMAASVMASVRVTIDITPRLQWEIRRVFAVVGTYRRDIGPLPLYRPWLPLRDRLWTVGS